MSDTLRVILKDVRLGSAEGARLERVYQLVAKTAVAPSTAASVRLVFRTESNDTTIEPFLGSAAFDALIGHAKKRADALTLLSRLVASAFLFTEEVDLLFVPDGTALPTASTDVSLEALGRLSKRTKGLYRVLAHLGWFHAVNAPATLAAPVELPDGRTAGEYSREVWVRAVDRQVASAAVESALTDDGARIVDVGPLEPAAPMDTGADADNILLGDRIYSPIRELGNA